MPQKKTDKPKRRTQVKELPKEEKALGKADLKKVKGGAKGGVIWLDPSSKPKK